MAFPTADDGYLLGYQAGDAGGHVGAVNVLARTHDGGRSWVRIPAPRGVVADGNDGSAVVSFATPRVGFIYAQRLWATADAGKRWSLVAAPSRVIDVEAGAGEVWVLAHGCAKCRTVRLYEARVGSSQFQQARDAPRFRNPDVEFVRGGGSELYIQSTVRARHAAVWRSKGGGPWTRQHAPCATYGVLVAWNPTGLAAVCNATLYGLGEESKQAFVSFDGANTWTALGVPNQFGYISDLAAQSSRGWILSEARGAFDRTNDGGITWHVVRSPVGLADGIGQVQFTSPTGAVAIPNFLPARAFLHSGDDGASWQLTRFPKRPPAAQADSAN
jgi:hypothetical protein